MCLSVFKILSPITQVANVMAFEFARKYDRICPIFFPGLKLLRFVGSIDFNFSICSHCIIYLPFNHFCDLNISIFGQKTVSLSLNISLVTLNIEINRKTAGYITYSFKTSLKPRCNYVCPERD